MSRSKKKRPLKPKIVFFVEGDTEKAFFVSLAQHYRLTAAKVIRILNCSGKDWVDKATSMMKNDPNCKPSVNTQFYIIFDRDNLSQQQIQTMQAKVKRLNCTGIKCNIGISNHNFEVWLLAHFKLVTSHSMSPAQLCQELSNCLGQSYQKANPVQIEKILSNDKVHNAIANSRSITPFMYAKQSTDIGTIIKNIL
ncbi:RloB family protein [Lactiplantibacillus plantarum]|uniref:RloB family protein n=1 Tax=Lactiplantibacillus plantarum TaxID=1590 RepID=UPI00351C5CCA